MIKEKVLITGFNGQLSNVLTTHLDTSKYELYYLTSSKNTSDSKNIFYWNIKRNHIDKEALINTKHIIHLSGFNIENSWTKRNKKIMFDSRIDSSKLLYNECLKSNIKLQTFISASAMGYYGFSQAEKKNENNIAGNDWLSKLCVKWEKCADNFKLINSRVIKLRLSLLIDKNNGVLKKTLLGYKFGIGLILGNGKQNFPWIHIKDAAKFIEFSISKKNIKGVFNVAAPEDISHYQFIKTIQQVAFNKSTCIHIPYAIINLLFWKKKKLILNNTSLCIKKMESTNFIWDYSTIKQALKAELNS